MGDLLAFAILGFPPFCMDSQGSVRRGRGDRAVAQLGSAPVWGTGGRRFKSCLPDQLPEPLIYSYRGLLQILPEI